MTLKLEVGRRYVDREGNRVTITTRMDHPTHPFYGSDFCRYREDGGWGWEIDGKYEPELFDLIALAPDEAPSGGGGTLVVAVPDELATLRERVRELEDRLFPYADEKEIAGMTWSGFHLIGNSKSIDELQRVCHRSSQLEEFQNAFDARLESEIARRISAETDRDTLRAENARLRGLAQQAANALYNLCQPARMAKHLGDEVAAGKVCRDAENG